MTSSGRRGADFWFFVAAIGLLLLTGASQYFWHGLWGF
jgi:hypothetical protein